MQKAVHVLLAALLWCGSSAVAHAVLIEYSVTGLGGSSYQYDYSVINDDLPVVEEFTIFFDVGLYESLSSPAAPATWDPLVIQPDPGLPDDGFYDALALGAPIGLGETLGGFSVVFDWLGAGTPGEQSFDIVDPFTFATLASGVTTPASSSSVPTPGAFVLMLVALGLLRATRSTSSRAG